ncbi:formylglycine-generating enzyme family protein [Akkermansiaceae bacterium]|nr:formylglycine-generating enzyme family protein [Akkermansiaceae bacterium]
MIHSRFPFAAHRHGHRDVIITADPDPDFPWPSDSCPVQMVAPVGQFKPGYFGLYDLSGNVSEPVVDHTTSNPTLNVTRGVSRMQIALRHPKRDFYSAKRLISDDNPRDEILAAISDGRFNDVGFRCVLDFGNSK